MVSEGSTDILTVYLRNEMVSCLTILNQFTKIRIPASPTEN
jgi:hypothetical protein